jgi:hypothetical protein
MPVSGENAAGCWFFEPIDEGQMPFVLTSSPFLSVKAERCAAHDVRVPAK